MFTHPAWHFRKKEKYLCCTGGLITIFKAFKLFCQNIHKSILYIHNYIKIYEQLYSYIKGIVSRDWGALPIILLDSYIVGSISAAGYF